LIAYFLSFLILVLSLCYCFRVCFISPEEEVKLATLRQEMAANQTVVRVEDSFIEFVNENMNLIVALVSGVSALILVVIVTCVLTSCYSYRSFIMLKKERANQLEANRGVSTNALAGSLGEFGAQMEEVEFRMPNQPTRRGNSG
jgi:hypothetical protein